MQLEIVVDQFDVVVDQLDVVAKRVLAWVLTTSLRALVAHFEFEPAYEGQVPQPTAAVTMSESTTCVASDIC